MKFYFWSIVPTPSSLEIAKENYPANPMEKYPKMKFDFEFLFFQRVKCFFVSYSNSDLSCGEHLKSAHGPRGMGSGSTFQNLLLRIC